MHLDPSNQAGHGKPGMWSHRFASSIVLVLSTFADVVTAQSVWAKPHHLAPSTSDSDPCASPRAYVSDHINRIKALQAAAPEGSASLFNMFTAPSKTDEKRTAQISELRNDAEGVNALLQAGGCRAFDLDRELAPAK